MKHKQVNFVMNTKKKIKQILESKRRLKLIIEMIVFLCRLHIPLKEIVVYIFFSI